MTECPTGTLSGPVPLPGNSPPGRTGLSGGSSPRPPGEAQAETRARLTVLLQPMGLLSLVVATGECLWLWELCSGGFRPRASYGPEWGLCQGRRTAGTEGAEAMWGLVSDSKQQLPLWGCPCVGVHVCEGGGEGGRCRCTWWMPIGREPQGS